MIAGEGNYFVACVNLWSFSGWVAGEQAENDCR